MQQSTRNGTKFGAYTLNRLIARGGMGEVYEAYESKLERRVALKLIAPTDPNEHDQDELIRRFMQEARTLARVNHPNVVTIFSIDNIVDVPFIAMEYVDGVAFRDLIEQFTFTADGAAPLFLQICEGVKCLHDNQIIHRDLKPHNILLRRDGQVKILDFGIAKAQGAGNDQTRAGVVVGTLPYMPPEVKTGAPASPRSDIWSLGAIFFECLTGDRLVSAQAEAPKGVEVPFNAAEVARIPAEMRAIITKMCAARPASRFQSVGEVMEELRKFRNARPPVPAATWDVLTQKVDEIAAASRQIADAEEPRVKFTQLLAKQQSDHPASGEIRDITGERQRAQLAKSQAAAGPPAQSRTMRWWIVPAAAAVLGGAFVFKVRQKIDPAATPPTPPPVVLKTNPAPALPAPPAAPASVIGPDPGVLNPPGAAVVSPAEPPTLTDPADGKVQWIEPEQIPTFAWSRLIDAGEYRFELSADRDFHDLRVSEPVAGGSYRPARPLDPGTYFWRLNAVRKDLKMVGPARFTLNVNQPVTLNTPEDQDRVAVKPREDGASVKFGWSCPSGTKQFRLEVSAFGTPKPVIDQSVGACEATLRKLGPGNYRWRVRPEPRVDQPVTPWSESRAFTVEPVTAPERERERERPAPTKTARVSLAEPRVADPTVTLPAGHAKGATLRWDAVKGARAYRVQVSANANFARPLVDEKASGTSFTWRHPAPGRHFWRVAAVSGSEQSGFSERGSIEQSVGAPVLNNRYRVATASVDLPSLPGAERYLIQVSRNRDLAGAQSQVSPRPRAILDESGGTFYVRMAAANAGGEAISSFSNLAQVDVDKPFAHPAPALLTPPNHARAPSRAGRISIIFSWDRSNGADQYVLEISNDENFRRVIERKNTAERGAVYKQAELTGRVYWRVRAKSAAGQSDWSKPNYFDVVN